MSVGCTIPLKQEFFTLEASWGFNMARTGEKVQLLEWSGYLKQLFNWRTLHTCIGCNATAAWRAPPIWKFGTANICIRICQFFNCISQFWWWHLLPRHLGQPVWYCLRISLIKIVPKMNFNCICNDLATGFLADMVIKICLHLTHLKISTGGCKYFSTSLAHPHHCSIGNCHTSRTPPQLTVACHKVWFSSETVSL